MFLIFATCTERTSTLEKRVMPNGVRSRLIFSPKSSQLAQIQPQLAISPPVISQTWRDVCGSSRKGCSAFDTVQTIRSNAAKVIAIVVVTSVRLRAVWCHCKSFS